ncbi:MAG: hypothetical protein KKC68_07960 [Candidatus Thermoplasmatota archaeon]|nr:hypothetical protein [Candidatus Thermoplasmatota archaeon]MBU1941692.1 hypothetical protein [Candidatus Thermoplasmatota archaeon]
MAKKRREKDEDEEIDFKLPKFDEAKFLAKERRNVKTLFISFIFGIVIAFICFGFWSLLDGSIFRWELVLLVGVFNISWLRYIFARLNIDLTDFGRRGWFGSFATYIFTWLIVLTILVNPPFYDNEAPTIELAILPGAQEPGGTVIIAAEIIDNVGIHAQDISLKFINPNGTELTPDFQYENNILYYEYTNPSNMQGEYDVTIQATDINGFVTTINTTFRYSNDALNIISSIFKDLRSGDPIIIDADEDISITNFRVSYHLDHGNEINISRKDPNKKDKYETTAEVVGWHPKNNYTMTLSAETTYYFMNNPIRYNNTVIDSTTYNFSTSTDNNIGTEPVDEPNYILPYPRYVAATPGFELLVFIISLIIVILMFKQRKNHR